MEELLYRPEELRWCVFRGTAAIADGLLTPTQLRGAAWRRLRRDIYVDSRAALDHGLACHAAALSLPDHATFSGRSAAWLHGVTHAAGFGDLVHVTLEPHARGRSAGVQVHRSRLDEADRELLDGLPVTSPRRTAWDLAALLPPQTAVPIIDTLLARALVTPDELAEYAQRRAGVRGCRKAADLFGLADGRARSPEASLMRLAIVEAGLPRPIPHYTVEAGRGELLQPELAWPAYRVALVFGGDSAKYEGADWRVIRVRPGRLAQDTPGVLRELRLALLGRGWRA